MSDDTENVIRFVVDDVKGVRKSYVSNDPTDEQKELASHIKELQKQQILHQRAFAQTTAAIRDFTSQLISGLKEEKQENSSAVG